MTQQLRFLIGLIVFSGIALGSGSPDDNVNSSPQNSASSESTPALAGAETHETRADSDAALQPPNPNENLAIEAVSSAPATRSSFMASWRDTNGAKGYLLDVSTNESFTDFVDGYHDFDVANATGRVVTGLDAGRTYYYRIRPYNRVGTGSYSEAMVGATNSTGGLTIHAVFDSSITGNPSAPAIEAMINRVISNYESLLSDPITIVILFRYATTVPDGSPFPQGVAAESVGTAYLVPWNTYIQALRVDARTSNDVLANASLPGSPISAHIVTKSANGRAVELNTPRAMFANGTTGEGGPYDGIVTLNSAVPYQFNRPIAASKLDAQRLTQHEINEVIGFGSRLGHTGSDLRPQDLFSWRSFRFRNFSFDGGRYFSIDRGLNIIVDFNQGPEGDLGDWTSGICPKDHPYVQDAFSCFGQSADVTATSPEGINLDVIGYDLTGVPAASPTDFNQDGHPDYLLSNPTVLGPPRTEIWELINNTLFYSTDGPTPPIGWQVVSVADFNRDGHPDYLLFNPTTRDTAIWYLNNNIRLRGVSGPTLPDGWTVVAVADFNRDSFPDYLLYNASTRRTVVWYMRDNVHIASDNGPTLPSGWRVAGVADFNRDGRPDLVLFKPSTGQSVIWYMSKTTHLNSRAGPTIPGPYQLVGVADFDGDGKPDYVLYNPSTQQTAIWYLNDNVFVHHAAGPTIPDRWTFIAP